MGVKRPKPTVNAGDTFLPAYPYDHLQVVCSDPAVDSTQVLLVSVTTFRPKEEECCMLAAGDHPFIKHRSCIRYKDARIVRVAALIKLLGDSQMTRRESVSPDLLARIRQGAAASEYLPEECRRLLESQSLI